MSNRPMLVPLAQDEADVVLKNAESFAAYVKSRDSMANYDTHGMISLIDVEVECKECMAFALHTLRRWVKIGHKIAVVRLGYREPLTAGIYTYRPIPGEVKHKVIADERRWKKCEGCGQNLMLLEYQILCTACSGSRQLREGSGMTCQICHKTASRVTYVNRLPVCDDCLDEAT